MVDRLADIMKEITFPRDGDRPLRFVGEEIVSVSSQAEGKDRWTELVVYRTSTGKFVLHSIGCSDREGEDDRSKAIAVDELTRATMEPFFKDSGLVRKLYGLLGLNEDAEVI